VATLDAYVDADIRARVRGFLESQNYKEGAAIKSNQLLFTIERTNYVAAVNEAEATLMRARVAQSHNRVQLERDRGLATSGTLSQQDLDTAAANLADADGQVRAAAAALEQAKLNLSYTEVFSPVEGVAGLALVRIGNLVGQDGPTLLTTVSQLDPMRVTFPLSEADYLRHQRRLNQLGSKDLTWAKKQFERLDSGELTDDGDEGVQLGLADGSTYPHRGVIVLANRQIDSSTGTILIQALVPNADAALRPGAYGLVRLKRQDAGHDVLVVPEKALVSVQGTYSVGMVGADNRIHMRQVAVGPTTNGVTVVMSGVAEGDRIVVDGVQRISDGALVDPKPEPPPAGSVMTSRK